ncbi:MULTISPECIES: sigma-70 family RNA polymerase sigma factor [Gracilimonas]|uniref:FliA/WhiG family RNA polymerase sigma factor n=1 Tax=Gracilimonas sediminicola TaxID=2952158 RepID=A0A9X2L3X6_9BACT|nr:FliA/WhiG family RNA polymerase sigma factor [Gracilimonas sediminicola]MCP9291878.1 FliA/WhiG family RNA polymerase sigma factor [Gracilimonas sediminicola]
MGNKSLQELVEIYCTNPADGIRNSIISKSTPLIRSIIGKINRPDQPLAHREDLESAGVIGLLQALDSYDCERNIQFNTFAYYRIRGSIVDYLRSIDQLPRKQRKNYGQVQEVIQRMSQVLGREPSDEEIANELEMDMDDYYKLLSNVQQRNVLSLDTPAYDENSGSFYEFHEDPNSETPDTNLEKKERTEALQKKIGQLKERDRLILMLYYYEDMTMSEIALLLELTEARISQIVGKLLIQLKGDLGQEQVVYVNN